MAVTPKHFLNKVCGGDMSVPTGKIVYTQFLNARGGIEADVTVTRLGETSYIIVTPAATMVREMNWLRRHQGDFNVSFVDVTSNEAVLAVMGPNSRKLLETVSSHDWSNENHPFGTAQEYRAWHGHGAGAPGYLCGRTWLGIVHDGRHGGPCV